MSRIRSVWLGAKKKFSLIFIGEKQSKHPWKEDNWSISQRNDHSSQIIFAINNLLFN